MSDPFADSKIYLDYGLFAEDVPLRPQLKADETPDSFILDGLRYRDGIYRAEWGKEYIYGGRSRTRERWKQKGFAEVMPDVPLYMATFTALFKCEPDQRTLGELLAEDMHDRMAVDTKVLYEPGTLDTVVHKSQTQLEKRNKARLQGMNMDIDNPLRQDVLQALLDTQDVTPALDAYKFFTGEKLSIWVVEHVDRPRQRSAGMGHGVIILNDNVQWNTVGGKVRPVKLDLIGGKQ